MQTGKGKHGMKKSSGKGSKDMGSGAKVKEPVTPPTRGKHLGDEPQESPNVLLIRTGDNNRIVPRYSAVLTRERDDAIGMEDLDNLQLELESLLSCAAMRHRSLQDDIVHLEALDERHKRSKLSQKPGAAAPTSMSKRAAATRPDLSRPPKKIKSELPSGGKLNRLRGLPSDGDAQSPKPDLPEVPKNEMPDKFWASVEPYCRTITQEDMTYLQDLIRIREEERNSDLLTIPPLGKHYTIKWAEDELANEVANKSSALGGTAGPMTQRLVAALVEDRNNPGLSVDEDRSRELSSARAAALATVKSPTFESRVREELREQGILDGDEAPKEQADDELLLEMKRCQSELKALSNHNLQRLKHLLSLSETQMQRQQLKVKLQSINNELLKVHATKQEKKHLSKKEKETTWRHIKDMKSILKELYPSLAVKREG